MPNSKGRVTDCRVVTQYNSDGERVYELETPGASLELRISSRAADGRERSWHVTAQRSNAADSASIAEEGDTRREALNKVAARWIEQAVELGLPNLDWVAVESALLAVRGV